MIGPELRHPAQRRAAGRAEVVLHRPTLLPLADKSLVHASQCGVLATEMRVRAGRGAGAQLAIPAVAHVDVVRLAFDGRPEVPAQASRKARADNLTILCRRECSRTRVAKTT